MHRSDTPEHRRLVEDAQRTHNWKRWGTYLAERQWATVREDYSATGECWDYFPHDQARSRAYRWGEDGLLGLTDRECRLCFAPALWNGRDPFLKERLFGLTGPEGNHGEDPKECWWYQDATPTHSYCRGLYRYPLGAFPYAQLRRENKARGRSQAEYELEDTGAFDENRFVDLTVEYAKAGPEDICIRLTVANRSAASATIHLLPTLWFRNSWSWGAGDEARAARPRLWLAGDGSVASSHDTLGAMECAAAPASDGTRPQWLFTENDTNQAQLFGADNATPYVKDAFHRYVVDGERAAVNPARTGTKAAALYRLEIPARGEVVVTVRLRRAASPPTTHAGAHPGKAAVKATAKAAVTPLPWFGAEFAHVLSTRLAEADAFYAALSPGDPHSEGRRVIRQAYAGLLWSKQFYHYVVRDWLDGDPLQPAPPAGRKHGRNADWPHLFNRDVISMPDKWEYPWYAAWDLAFHTIPLARVDPQFAKDQLILFLREWYMHPNGQLPAYEFALGDVNPPVHAWAAWRVYRMTSVYDSHGRSTEGDTAFLERVFQKLLLNFTWWVNRKDVGGKHLFAGGFLGLDNIGVFDRSKPLPSGTWLEQADGTAWMAFYAGRMLTIALELAKTNPVYEDIASKFLEHYIEIAEAINTLGSGGLWNEEDGFYYDQLTSANGSLPMRVRSLVGVIPMFAVEILDVDILERFPGFSKRLTWFLDHRHDLTDNISYMETMGDPGNPRRLLALPSRERLRRMLGYVLDEREFLSPHGVRSVSRVHADRPFVLSDRGQDLRVGYEPGESTSGMFGGNSNWRGPVWFPLNYLLIESLERYYAFYGDAFTIECPTGSGVHMTLAEVSRELARRLGSLFLPDADGARPCMGGAERYRSDPLWRDHVMFHEYFHGDTGAGLGASHQTGWTALAALCLERMGDTKGMFTRKRR
ncbi:MAG: glucosidase [Planctomycetes bacterium]|nr:glucosidase [Planctomycetota bacterium]